MRLPWGGDLPASHGHPDRAAPDPGLRPPSWLSEEVSTMADRTDLMAGANGMEVLTRSAGAAGFLNELQRAV
jgi:hypothetical protein